MDLGQSGILVDKFVTYDIKGSKRDDKLVDFYQRRHRFTEGYTDQELEELGIKPFIQRHTHPKSQIISNNSVNSEDHNTAEINTVNTVRIIKTGKACTPGLA